MNILITSPRAPAVIDWIRMVLRNNHKVILCDSLNFPIGRFLRSKNIKYQRLPAPKLDLIGYRRGMLELIAQADLVIPTCEDIFYLAQLPLKESDRQKCLMPSKDLLLQLHHKVSVFSLLPRTQSIGFPSSHLISRHHSIIDDDISGIKTVLKPVFSRFGRHVIRGVNKKNTQHLEISSKQLWVQQEFIEGTPLCNFAICQHGKLIAHAVYRPRYLVNQSASTYFETVGDQRLDAFMLAFAKEHHFHGQVAFDFIDDGTTLWVLECNPRVTSGIHLLSDCLSMDEFGEIHLNQSFCEKKIDKVAYRVGASLPLLFGLSALKNGQFKALMKDYRGARNVLAGLPFYATWLAFLELLKISFKKQVSLSDASTFDIEYDG